MTAINRALLREALREIPAESWLRFAAALGGIVVFWMAICRVLWPLSVWILPATAPLSAQAMVRFIVLISLYIESQRWNKPIAAWALRPYKDKVSAELRRMAQSCTPRSE